MLRTEMRYKISMNFSRIIEAQSEEEATKEFWDEYAEYEYDREPKIKILK